jgi:hypothetical protein
VADLPTLDVFVHTSAVRSLTPHDELSSDDATRAEPVRLTIVTETVAFLEEVLPEPKPAFREQYRGAKLRVNDKAPDAWTQASASMRKLIKGVLHTVAADEHVLPGALKTNKP